jgi:hypothetical protein
MDPDDERGTLNQIAYSLIFVRDLTDPKIATQLAEAIADGRGFASSTEDLVAAIDSTLAKQRVHPQSVEIAEHSEPDLLAFLAKLRAEITTHKP